VSVARSRRHANRTAGRAKRALLIAALVAVPLLSSAQSRPSRESHVARSADSTALAMLRERSLQGRIIVRDVGTMATIVDASTLAASDTAFLPLSTTKLIVAAIAWDHGFDANADSMIVLGFDSVGRRLALMLRAQMGTGAVLAAAGQLGFPVCRGARRLDCFMLDERTSDTAWASTFSIGEVNVRVTLGSLSRFLGLVGRGGDSAMSRTTAARLNDAMRRTVERGTAVGARDRMPEGWRIGGKTGTGPARANPLDGIFAGVVDDPSGGARYTVVTYIRGGGAGGGAAARLSADVVRDLISR